MNHSYDNSKLLLNYWKTNSVKSSLPDDFLTQTNYYKTSKSYKPNERFKIPLPHKCTIEYKDVKVDQNYNESSCFTEDKLFSINRRTIKCLDQICKDAKLAANDVFFKDNDYQIATIKDLLKISNRSYVKHCFRDEVSNNYNSSRISLNVINDLFDKFPELYAKLQYSSKYLFWIDDNNRKLNFVSLSSVMPIIYELAKTKSLDRNDFKQVLLENSNKLKTKISFDLPLSIFQEPKHTKTHKRTKSSIINYQKDNYRNGNRKQSSELKPPYESLLENSIVVNVTDSEENRKKRENVQYVNNRKVERKKSVEIKLPIKNHVVEPPKNRIRRETVQSNSRIASTAISPSKRNLPLRNLSIKPVSSNIIKENFPSVIVSESSSSDISQRKRLVSKYDNHNFDTPLIDKGDDYIITERQANFDSHYIPKGISMFANKYTDNNPINSKISSKTKFNRADDVLISMNKALQVDKPKDKTIYYNLKRILCCQGKEEENFDRNFYVESNESLHSFKDKKQFMKLLNHSAKYENIASLEDYSMEDDRVSHPKIAITKPSENPDFSHNGTSRQSYSLKRGDSIDKSMYFKDDLTESTISLNKTPGPIRVKASPKVSFADEHPPKKKWTESFIGSLNKGQHNVRHNYPGDKIQIKSKHENPSSKYTVKSAFHDISPDSPSNTKAKLNNSKKGKSPAPNIQITLNNLPESKSKKETPVHDLLKREKVKVKDEPKSTGKKDHLYDMKKSTGKKHQTASPYFGRVLSSDIMDSQADGTMTSTQLKAQQRRQLYAGVDSKPVLYKSLSDRSNRRSDSSSMIYKDDKYHKVYVSKKYMDFPVNNDEFKFSDLFRDIPMNEYRNVHLHLVNTRLNSNNFSTDNLIQKHWNLFNRKPLNNNNNRKTNCNNSHKDEKKFRFIETEPTSKIKMGDTNFKTNQTDFTLTTVFSTDLCETLSSFSEIESKLHGNRSKKFSTRMRESFIFPKFQNTFSQSLLSVKKKNRKNHINKPNYEHRDSSFGGIDPYIMDHNYSSDSMASIASFDDYSGNECLPCNKTNKNSDSNKNPQGLLSKLFCCAKKQSEIDNESDDFDPRPVFKPNWTPFGFGSDSKASEENHDVDSPSKFRNLFTPNKLFNSTRLFKKLSSKKSTPEHDTNIVAAREPKKTKVQSSKVDLNHLNRDKDPLILYNQQPDSESSPENSNSESSKPASDIVISDKSLPEDNVESEINFDDYLDNDENEFNLDEDVEERSRSESGNIITDNSLPGDNVESEINLDEDAKSVVLTPDEIFDQNGQDLSEDHHSTETKSTPLSKRSYAVEDSITMTPTYNSLPPSHKAHHFNSSKDVIKFFHEFQANNEINVGWFSGMFNGEVVYGYNLHASDSPRTTRDFIENLRKGWFHNHQVHGNFIPESSILWEKAMLLCPKGLEMVLVNAFQVILKISLRFYSSHGYLVRCYTLVGLNVFKLIKSVNYITQQVKEIRLYNCSTSTNYTLDKFKMVGVWNYPQPRFSIRGIYFPGKGDMSQ